MWRKLSTSAAALWLTCGLCEPLFGYQRLDKCQRVGRIALESLHESVVLALLVVVLAMNLIPSGGGGGK